MKKYYYLAFIIFMFSCSHNEEKKRIKLANNQSIVLPIAITVNYDSCKKTITHIKSYYKKQWETYPSKQTCEKDFINAVAQTIIPAWIGTKWDFNGTTEQPRQGSIACGYFVTTVLRDAGLPIARIKLAQCASEEMIKALVQKKYIYRFSNVQFENFIQFLNNNGDGLYIIGLDNHTGFLLKDSAGLWFIHSTYIGTANVQKEKAITSSILKNSKYKIIGKISADELVFHKWIRG